MVRVEEAELAPQPARLVPPQQVQHDASLLDDIHEEELGQHDEVEAVAEQRALVEGLVDRIHRACPDDEEDAQQELAPRQHPMARTLMLLVERLPRAAQRALRARVHRLELGRGILDEDRIAHIPLPIAPLGQRGAPSHAAAGLQGVLRLDGLVLEGEGVGAHVVPVQRWTCLRRVRPRHLQGPSLLLELPGMSAEIRRQGGGIALAASDAGRGRRVHHEQEGRRLRKRAELPLMGRGHAAAGHRGERDVLEGGDVPHGAGADAVRQPGGGALLGDDLLELPQVARHLVPQQELEHERNHLEA
mmetsp:Transcript_129724/g.375728  ORF Transcript_129724/g.375728 Transcript_129724/m.375728 type:complete len:303 (-) Transcript_129724:59-967(-)